MSMKVLLLATLVLGDRYDEDEEAERKTDRAVFGMVVVERVLQPQTK